MITGAAAGRRRIAVAGGGPAGLAAALMLHRAGHAVTLFERFERPRPLGSGLMIQPTGLAVLDALGLGETLAGQASPIDRMFGRAVGTGRVVLDVRYAPLAPARGLGVHRASLFWLLYEAVQAAGIAMVTGRTVTESRLGAGGRSLVFADGEAAGPFDLVVDALGHASPLTPPVGRELAYGALWASLDWPGEGHGLDAHALEQRYRRASVMVGVLPIGQAPERARPQTAFFWSLRTDRYEAWRAAGLEAWKAEVRGLWPATAPLLDQIRDEAQLTFARYTHRTIRRPYQPALAHIGDAWHSTSPQLGQGANMALLDAWALARALEAAPDVAAALGLYNRLRRGHVGLYQAMSSLFTPVYQSDSWLLPLLRDRLVGPLAKIWPAPLVLAAMVGGLVGAPLGRLGLTRRR